MAFIEESLKFIIMGFFKRCRIITQILIAIKDNIIPETRESIMLEFISNNFRWCFMTVRACIEKGGSSNQIIDDEASGEEQEPVKEGDLLDRLSIFGQITE